MAQDLVETSVEAEGSDDLRTFLVKYKSELKLTNATKLNGLYDKLSEEMGYDDMIELTEQDLRPSLSDCGLKSIQIGRIIAILKKIPESEIYKQQNAVKVVAISNEEEDALINIKKAAEKVDEIINNITINISKLDENSKQSATTIDQTFDDIIKSVNKRRTALLLQLKNMKETKQNKLTVQQNDWKSHKKALNECYEKSQIMVRDLNMDKQKRKKKILSTTNQLLSNKSINNFKLATGVTVEFKVNMKDINKVLSTAGSIESKDVPLPPVINVESKKDTSAIIGIVSINESSDTKGIEYKLEYCQHDDDDIKSDDDMKINWTAITIKYQQNIEYEIKALTPSRSYNIRASLRNEHGCSGYCDNILFKTTKKNVVITDKFDPQNIGVHHTVNGNCIVHTGEEIDCTSWCAKVVSKGKHRWKFRIEKYALANYNWTVIGILKNGAINDPNSKKYFPQNGNGYGWIASRAATAKHSKPEQDKKYGIMCKEQDIIDMYLDLDRLTLGYSVNGTSYGVAFKIEKTSYRAVLSTIDQQTSVRLLSYSCEE